MTDDASGILLAYAPAKINLGLEVVRKRPDDYHDLATIMQTIALCDEFHWHDTGMPFTYSGPDGVEPEADLVRRALALATDRDQWTGTLTLRKRIPVAAGLGGGSTDAAVALRLALPTASEDEIAGVGERLGSDVPFLLRGGTALASGTGTTLSPLPTPEFALVLLTPLLEIPAKTPTLYHGLQPADFSSGQQVEDIADRLRQSLALPSVLPNSFARQLLQHAAVRYAYGCLARAASDVGMSLLSVSGAGPTLYAIAPDEERASAIAKRIPDDAGAVVVSRAVAARDNESVSRMAAALRGV